MPVKTKADTKKARRIPLPGSVVGLLNRQQVCEALGGCSQRKLSMMISSGEYPRADTRLGRNPRWSVVLFNEWCEGHRTKTASEG